MGTVLGYIFACAAVCFIVFIILGMCGVWGNPSTSEYKPNTLDQTKKLTSNEIQSYMSLMDKSTASAYRKAIKNGQRTFNVGKGLIMRWEAARQSQDIDSYFDNIKQETAKIQREGKEWSRQNEIVGSSRVNGMDLEKAGDIYGAISAYERSIEDGIKQTKTVIYNYAYSIERLAILYRKTKQIDKEIDFLTDMIKKHPKYEGRFKWKERRDKAKALKDKQDSKL